MNTEQLNRIGQGGIVQEGIFVRFPDLVPAVREHYWREDSKHSKLLLIGESNYFDEHDMPYSDFTDAEKWYQGKDAKLIPDYRKTAVNNDIGYKTFTKVFNIMGKVLRDCNIDYSEGLAEAVCVHL